MEVCNPSADSDNITISSAYSKQGIDSSPKLGELQFSEKKIYGKSSINMSNMVGLMPSPCRTPLSALIVCNKCDDSFILTFNSNSIQIQIVYFRI